MNTVLIQGIVMIALVTTVMVGNSLVTEADSGLIVHITDMSLDMCLHQDIDRGM